MKNPSLHPALRIVMAVSLACFALVKQAWAADSSWTFNGNGNYSDSLNWSSGVPGATSGTTSTDVATFNRTTFTSGAGVITLDTGYNLAGITFNSTGTGNNITVGNSTTNRFTFSDGGLIQGIGNVAGTYVVNS